MSEQRRLLPGDYRFTYDPANAEIDCVAFSDASYVQHVYSDAHICHREHKKIDGTFGCSRNDCVLNRRV